MKSDPDDNNENLKIAVISDLHAQSSEGYKEGISFLHSGLSHSSGEDPISALKSLITTDKLQADVVLCPGDLADKASPDGVNYAWHKLQEIAAWLGADFLAATAGNHDVDSRYQHNDHDAKGMLQGLEPHFPVGDLRKCDQYWARNFVTYEDDRLRLLILNSSAYHGENDEFRHGRISGRTQEALKKEIANCEQRPINILLCHHHPQRFSSLTEEDYSEMRGGDSLVKILENSKSNWLVVHGHQHFPNIFYASGSSLAPIIFGAGSFSACLYPELQTRARNQFYILEFPILSPVSAFSSIKGYFKAWDYIWNIGWRPARENSGLPHNGGFGWKGDFPDLAERVESYLRTDGNAYIVWSKLTAQMPELRHMLPNDLNRFIHLLEENMGVHVLRDKHGAPEQVGFPDE